MSKWKPGNLPRSIAEYGIDHQIWTDRDLAKFCAIVFVAGVFFGFIIGTV
jgi:hypothetical protein